MHQHDLDTHRLQQRDVGHERIQQPCCTPRRQTPRRTCCCGTCGYRARRAHPVDELRVTGGRVVGSRRRRGAGLGGREVGLGIHGRDYNAPPCRMYLKVPRRRGQAPSARHPDGAADARQQQGQPPRRPQEQQAGKPARAARRRIARRAPASREGCVRCDGRAHAAPRASAARGRRTEPGPADHVPESLPVSGKRDEIARAIAGHQVVIVCGETGSARPRSCRRSVDLGRGLGAGGTGLIGHTQPRRLAASSTGRRIAEGSARRSAKWSATRCALPTISRRARP